MKRKLSDDELRTLIDSIKASDVVESRAQLISELGELDVTDEKERASILEVLTTLWEDFTCLDVSQCMLNKTILQVATTYLKSDTSMCHTQYLALGTKASIWCRKHMKMTLMSTDDSQEEEHYSLFFQVLLNLLSHSADVLKALTKHPVSTEKELMTLVETFIMELLNVTKDSIIEVKKIQTFGPDILNASQLVLNAVIDLCKTYCNDMKLDDKVTTEKDGVNHIINITKCTVENLVNLGIVAANAGGDLVNLLNLSWKGVITLLQLFKESIAVNMNISEIILSLISLAKGSLSCAGQTWSKLTEPVSTADAKRIFIPVKFYLINAARIISYYPSQAFAIFKDIALCILIILSFRIYLGQKELFKSASEALSEFLEPTSLHLLNSLLNSAQLEHNHKREILDWLFSDISVSNFVAKDGKSTDEILFFARDSMQGSNTLLLGQLCLFVNLLRSGPDLEADVSLEIAKKLNWLFDVLIEENVYSSILAYPIPLLHNSGHQIMFSSVIHALKTFMLVASSTSIWLEIESFLLENLFHPHHLCYEIVMQLWCFLIRHAESDMANDIIIKLYTLLKTTASWESVLNPKSALRKLAKSIRIILKNGSQSLTDRVFHFIINSKSSKVSSVVYVALLMEGFPLDHLSNNVRSVAKQRLVTDYFCFLDAFNDESLTKDGDERFGAPVFALSAALQSRQVSVSDTEMKTIKLLTATIHKYNNASDNSKDRYLKILSETLGIISSMKHLYRSDEMGKLILDLHNLFISKSTELTKCKPNLAAFVAGLGDIEFEETDTNSTFSASWALFHKLLQERHWALAHLAITAFGYFSARTSCKELWRFVPEDAALSFDLESGKDADEERFMSEFKVFLDKEAANVKTTPGENEVMLLMKEGLVLKQMMEKNQKMVTDEMEVDEIKRVDNVKKRKYPDGISEGFLLLKNGLRVIANGISLWKQNGLDFADINGEFLTQFSHLEDAVGHMAASIE